MPPQLLSDLVAIKIALASFIFENINLKNPFPYPHIHILDLKYDSTYSEILSIWSTKKIIQYRQLVSLFSVQII